MGKRVVFYIIGSNQHNEVISCILIAESDKWNPLCGDAGTQFQGSWGEASTYFTSIWAVSRALNNLEEKSRTL